MAVVLLDRISGDNPEGWIFRAERYFTYLGFSQKDWLPLPSFYFDGEALIWFNGLFRNKQFFDWNYFKVKLLLQFRQWSLTSSTEGVACFDSISVATIALLEILHAAIESDLTNGKQEEATESKYVSDLDGKNLRPADNSKVPPEIFVASIGNFLHPTDFTSSIVLIGSNCDGDTPLEIKIDEEDYSKSFACKVFAEIPYREFDMDFKHSIPNATQVFEEKSDNCCSKVLANESDLDDDNSEKDKLLAKIFLQDIYGLPSQNVQVFLLGQYSEARDTGLQKSGYVDKWFDTGQEFIIALQYERGVSTKELHSNDGKVRILDFNVSPKLACEVLEQAMGSHVTDVRTQNKWTMLSSPAYFMCNILTTTLKNLPPTNYSSWSVDLQAHFYYFSISFIVYHTFLNLPFDPGIPDTPLFYGADKTLVTTGRFLSTYILIAALWGEEVCCLVLNHVSTAAIPVKHFSSALEVFLASNPVILVRHIWIKRRDSLLEDIGPHSADIIELEKARQWNGHKLIPSENFKSLSVMSVVRSILPIIFNERYRGRSYYEGDKYIDMTTKLCQENALEVFKFDPATWRLNVQLLTRSLTNFRLCIALLEPHEKCLTFFRPKLIVASASGYARLCDYACIRKIGNTQSEVIFLADMVHINGLVAAKVLCFSLKDAIVVVCSTQFMGGQGYVFVVLDKSFFAFEDFDIE